MTKSIRFRFFSIGIVAIASVAVSTTAIAQSRCDPILNKNMMDEKVVEDRDAAALAVQSYYCQMTFQQASASGGFALGLRYRILDLNSTNSENSFNAWQNQNCGSLTTSQHQQRYYYSAQKAIHAGVVPAWEKCIKDAELFCAIKPKKVEDDETILYIDWRGPGTLETRADSSEIRNGRNTTRSELGERVFADNQVIKTGSERIGIKSKDRSKGTTILINVIYGNDRKFSCEAYFPSASELKSEPPRVSALPDLNGRWCPTEGTQFPYNGVLVWQRSGGEWKVQNERPGSKSQIFSATITEVDNHRFTLEWDESQLFSPPPIFPPPPRPGKSKQIFRVLDIDNIELTTYEQERRGSVNLSIKYRRC